MPQPPEDPRHVAQLIASYWGEVDGPKERVEAAAEPQSEAACGEPVHRRGERGGNQDVPRVVVRSRGRDADSLTHGTGRAGQGGRLLQIESLGDEGATEADALGLAYLVYEIPWRVGVPSQGVEAQFVQRFGHPDIISLMSPAFPERASS